MHDYAVKSPRKLIEVALPLDAINLESLRRKQKAPKGWPTSFHKWWAQRPLAAARAVIFSQLVNDPGYQQGSGFKYGKNKKEAANNRKALFELLEELITWDNSSNEAVLARARAEIQKSWREVCDLNKDHPQAKELFDPEKFPTLYDPFSGSGTIPLEAQRLGLETQASDLNPVAVLINKAVIEIPAQFASCPPVNPTSRAKFGATSSSWRGATGLAEDVRYYGAWMGTAAHDRIGHLYPPIEVTGEMVRDRPDLKQLKGEKLKIIAWIWARTVKSPNPAFSDVEVPLASSFILSSKLGREAYVNPVVKKDGYTFTVMRGTPPAEAATGTGVGKRKAFRCLLSRTPIDYDYIRREGKAGRMGQRLMAMVAEGRAGRVYLSPTSEMETLGARIRPQWKPETLQPDNPRDFKTPNYGLMTFGDIFTPRQLESLFTFGTLIAEARAVAFKHALDAGMPNDGVRLEERGSGADAYADAIAVYLACVLDRMIYYGSSLTTWLPKDSALRDCMPRQALAMTWDFAEANPLGKSSGDINTCINSIANYLDIATPFAKAIVEQRDAAAVARFTSPHIVSTDPPYYDNIGYADLSDFFYVWLRPVLRPILPKLFATIAVPKAEELVATPYRHGGKEQAEAFFLKGMTRAIGNMATHSHPAFPIVIYYAFKQAETEDEAGTSSTGWETFLEAVCRSGLAITGTWPMRTEGAGRMLAKGNNALASSIILVCRKRSADALTVSRREFLRELNAALPAALDEMTKGVGNDQSAVAPVDLSQAIIGPGMAIFSRYAAVLEADGSPMSVNTALKLINRFFAEDDFDHDTQFCLQWFQQHGWNAGAFGQADVLARAKGTSVDGVRHAGIIASGGGNVRLLKWSEYPDDWDPQTDERLPVWECLHHLIRAHRVGGDSAAGNLLAATKQKAEAARQLAYRLFTLCERSGWADDARAYNEIITSWAAIESAAGAVRDDRDLFGDTL